MSGRDGLAILLDELSAMPASSRRAILRDLSSAERDALADLSMPEPVSTGTSSLSPWLLAILETARNNDPFDPAASRMTAATRQALLRSADALSRRSTEQPKASPSGKSLFDAFGGKLGARMGRL